MEETWEGLQKETVTGGSAEPGDSSSDGLTTRTLGGGVAVRGKEAVWGTTVGMHSLQRWPPKAR